MQMGGDVVRGWGIIPAVAGNAGCNKSQNEKKCPQSAMGWLLSGMVHGNLLTE